MISLNDFSVLSVDKDQRVHHVDQFHGTHGKRVIELEEGASLTYLFIVQGTAFVDIEIITKGERAQCEVYGLVIGEKEEESGASCFAHLHHSQSSANLHIVSFLLNQTVSQVDGGVYIHPGIEKASGHLLEENILLGKQIKIKSLPLLDVRSNDVSASHGSRIHTLDKEKIFYMGTKGLTKKESSMLMLKGYVETLFEPFLAYEGEQLESIKSDNLEKIISGVAM